MTRATFFVSENGYNGFEIKGHSGYADYGHDIVCAAVSSAVSLSAALLEKAGCLLSFDSDAEAPFVSLKITPCPCGNNIIATLLEQLEGICADYGNYLSVTQKRIR